MGDTTVNQRTRLTIRLIQEAFLRLLERGGFEQVTVSAICAEAQINRSTFYRYYDNQFQLLEIIENELIDELESHGTETNYLDSSFEARQIVRNTQIDFFRCIESKINLYRTLVERVHPNIFEKTHLLRKTATARALSPELGETMSEYAADFIIAGGQKLVVSWILKGRGRETPEEITDVLLNMLYGTIDGLK